MGEDVLSVGEGGFLFIQLLKFGKDGRVKRSFKALESQVIVPLGS